MACNTKITMDILYDCADRPKGGIDGGKAILINYSDIDFAASTANGATITDLVLKTGTTGYAVEWYKDLASFNSAFVPNTEDVEGFTHNFLTRLPNTSAANAERAAELASGRFIMVFETNYKGTANAEAFKIAGWQMGLGLTEMTNNTLENSGSTLYTLANKEGQTEQYPYNVFLEVDYLTSKATFDALFAEPVTP